MREYQLLLDILDLLPLALQVLLPQADLVVTTADGKNVTAQTPANTPQNGIKLECLAGPLARVGSVGGPDADGLVLGGGGNVRFGQNAGGPGHVADPV